MAYNQTTQYTEDVAHTTGDKGTMFFAVRNDTPGTLSNASGDYTPLQLSAAGALYTHDIVLDNVIGIVGAAAPSSVIVIGAEDASGNVRQPLMLSTGFDTQPDTDIAMLMTNRNFLYNGTTWDRMRGDTTNGLDVDVTRLPALAAGTNNIGDVDVLTINGVAPAFGTGVRGATVQRVTIATDDSVPVTGTFWQATQPVSLASVPSHAVTNAGTFVTQENGAALTAMQLLDDTIFTDDAAFTPGTSKVSAIGLMADEASTDSVDEGDIGIPRMTVNRKQIVTARSATGTQTSVSSSATNVTLLAANTSREGATLYNDSTQICYVRLQATATSANFSVKMQPEDYYEVPAGYTGIIDGIWASANGSMRVTELT